MPMNWMQQQLKLKEIFKEAYKARRAAYLKRQEERRNTRKGKLKATAASTPGPDIASEIAVSDPKPKAAAAPKPAATAEASKAAAKPAKKKKKKDAVLDDDFLGDLLADPLGKN